MPADSGGRTDTGGLLEGTGGAGRLGPALPPLVTVPDTDEEKNHVIGPDDTLYEGGAVTKARNNITAIKLLKKLLSENRLPGKDEKSVLAKYTGWGGIPQAFDRGKSILHNQNWEKTWLPVYDELIDILTPDELLSAKVSTVNAHYTGREIINRMWEAVYSLGFKGGKTAELGAGIGYFPGLQPEGDERNRTSWTAVELDKISSQILERLYPMAEVYGVSLNEVKLPPNSFDLVIGNVPFAQESVYDPDYPGFNLHNYFLARGIDALRPGAVLMCLTSIYTLDSPSSRKARQYFAERADLAGAVRLPQKTFMEVANTEVSTDLLVFRKKDHSVFRGHNFVNSVPVKLLDKYGEEETYYLNEYFDNNPGSMIGSMSLKSGQYGNSAALVNDGNLDVYEKLKEIFDSFPKNIMSYGHRISVGKAEKTELISSADYGEVKNGAFILDNGVIRQKTASGFITPDFNKSKTVFARTCDFIELRDHLMNHFSLMRTKAGNDNAEIDSSRETLNKLYDSFVKNHGNINYNKKLNYLEDDPNFYTLLSLEKTEKKRVLKDGLSCWERTFRKSDIFTKRTLFPFEQPTRAGSIEDAVNISLSFRNRIDIDYISSLTGGTVEECEKSIIGNNLAFIDPVSGLITDRDEYLSGNIREKLAEANKAAKSDSAYERNVKELVAVLPNWIDLKDIRVILGAEWIPPEVVGKFIEDTVEVECRVDFVRATGTWKLNRVVGKYNAKNTDTYGTEYYPAHSIIEQTLNLKHPAVYDTFKTPDGKKCRKINVEKTALARAKANELKVLFEEWVYSKGAELFKDDLEKSYNTKFNSHVERTFRAPDFKWYPGMARNENMVPRTHQKKVISRILREGTLLAHSVGTGKTLIMCTAAMEMKRTGIATKTMIVVQNSTIEQFAQSFSELYPDAKILVPSKRQREAKQRNKIISQIMTGDYDAVIIPHSFFNLLPNKPEVEKKYIAEQINELENILYEMKHDREGGGRSFSVKQIARQILTLQTRYDNLLDRKKDDTVYFEDLGVDALYIDEAHAYKKVPFITKRENIKGLDKSSSQRAFSTVLKLRHVQEKTNGKNVVLATGTPISNTLTECWNVIRSVRPDIIKDYNVETFDAFSSTFADTVVMLEQTSGGTWKTVERFAKYKNVPELIKFFRMGADVVLTEQTNIEVPVHYQGKPVTVAVERSEQLSEFIGVLRRKLEWFDGLNGKEKKENCHIPLTCFTEGRKAAVDIRLIDSSMTPEGPSKIEEMTKIAAELHRETKEDKSTQLIFCDIYRNIDGNFNVFTEIREKLINSGIPENEICVINDCKTDEQRKNVFDNVQTGNIRILMGSTQKMGIGVNVQNRCRAIHHLDAPFMPGDMEQRNGRAFRQGNVNPEVREYRYGVVNTLDSTIYQILAVKDKMIKQVMRGELTERDLNSGSEDISYEQQMAIYSGNPLAIEKVTIDNELRNLRMLKNSFLSSQRDAAIRISSKQSSLEFKKKTFKLYERNKTDFDQLFKRDAGKIILNGTTYEHKEFSKAFDSLCNRGIIKAIEQYKNKFSEKESVMIDAGSLEILGTSLKLFINAPFNMNGRLEEDRIRINFSTSYKNFFDINGNVKSAQGFFSSFKSCIGKYEENAQSLRSGIDTLEKDIAELSNNTKAGFKHEDRLKELETRLEQIEKSLQTFSKQETAEKSELENKERIEEESTVREEIENRKQHKIGEQNVTKCLIDKEKNEIENHQITM